MRTVALLALLLALSACGNSEDGSPDPKDGSSAAAESSPTADDLPKVSEATTCDLLFNSGSNHLAAIIGFIARPSSSQGQARITQDSIDEIRDIASSAQDPIGAQLDAIVGEAQAFVDGAYEEDPPGRDVSAVKAAGTEITNLCIPYF